ncbi:epidermal growth factor receptor kinase substrate 8-like isoform X2 [Littorina saxatilis]|uniref:epidermal growth factor receptor kinase substrate 8-like isoform X2 n=1 Tax=Littorina saxatilis TaxID=31220 RepID=UPI0038B4ADE1
MKAALNIFAALFCCSQADLFEIFKRHDIEIDKEIRDGLLTLYYKANTTPEASANQSYLEWLSGFDLATNQHANAQSTVSGQFLQQSKTTSINQQTQNSRSTNQQSSSNAASAGKERGAVNVPKEQQAPPPPRGHKTKQTDPQHASPDSHHAALSASQQAAAMSHIQQHSDGRKPSDPQSGAHDQSHENTQRGHRNARHDSGYTQHSAETPRQGQYSNPYYEFPNYQAKNDLMGEDDEYTRAALAKPRENPEGYRDPMDRKSSSQPAHLLDPQRRTTNQNVDVARAANNQQRDEYAQVHKRNRSPHWSGNQQIIDQNVNVARTLANQQKDVYAQVNKRRNNSPPPHWSGNQQTANQNEGAARAAANEQRDTQGRIRHSSQNHFRHLSGTKQGATPNQSDGNIVAARTGANTQAENWQGRYGMNKSDERYKIPPPPSGPAPEPPGTGRDPYDFGGFRETIEQRQYSQFNVSQYGASQFNNGGNFLGGAQRTSMMARPSYLPYREREDEVGSNELLERDVQLLNHCFDDIEKFVARLQQAAEAYKELERRRRERGAKGKKVASGDGMLGQRARPPPANDFIDIFQKFKLSFNLLAKLKAHIHDPNAPELVHFLFTPLSLIYEASRDPIHGNMNLGEQAVAPVLTQDAKQLLLNCLTSKEIELWQALGKNWTTSKDEWKGHCPAYVPKFYDGWQPAPTLVDEPTTSRSNFQAPMDPPHMQSRVIQHEVQQNYVPVRPMPFPDEDPYNHRERIPDYQRERIHDFERAPTPTRNMGMQNNSSAAYNHYEEKSRPRAPEPVQPSPPQQRPIIDDNSAYLEELRRTGGSIYIVNHDRQGKNSKELSVHKGDVLQVLDNNRNWWKVRNYKGETGYCPYTILRAADATDNGRDGGSALNTSAEQAAGHSRKTSSRDTSTLSEPPLEVRRKESREGPPSSRFEEIRIPPLGMGEEEEEERHAFRPVEPAALYANKGAFGMRKNQPQDDLHNELRTKMGIGALQRRGGGLEMHHNPENTSFESHGSGGAMGQQFYITADSSQHDVTAWLEMKGFTTLCVQMLKGYTGRDMFALHRHEMEQLLGHEEATRLEGQVTLQKKMTGYKTQSAAELNAIFHKRRARTDQQGAQLGQPPGFRPLSPSNSYDGQDSDSDNDDRHLADTGKTLRDLLIRQRQKISGAGVFDQQ